MRFLAWLALPSLAVLASCGSDAAPIDPSAYFAPPSLYSDTTCNTVDGELTGRREMKLFQTGPVEVLSLTQGLQRYYRRHSLAFSTAEVPRDAGTPYALDTSDAALGLALTQAFPGVDLNDEAALIADPALYDQVLTFAANFILRPMIDFAVRNAAGPDVTNLVVVPDLERPGGRKVGDPGTALAGLAISPALLGEFACTMPDEGQIWRNVQLPLGFTPMMFLGYKVIVAHTKNDSVLRDLVVSHEFGHTGGLTHTDVQGNLMFPAALPGVDTCHDSLDATQLAAMRANLGLVSAQAGALTIAPPRPSKPRAPAARRFKPADLRAMLAGDARAMRLFLEPLLSAGALPR